VTTGTALLCIRRRNVKAHKQWMVRSYIITFAFVLFRLATDYVPAESLWGVSRQEMSIAMIWPVWVLPLLAYEAYLQYRERERSLAAKCGSPRSASRPAAAR
jgi:uncharacterized membrane protein YozB (DUF420 family)